VFGLWGQAEASAKPRRVARVLVQALVSAAILAVLVTVARRGDVLAALRGLAPEAVAAAVGLQLVACVLNARRWQVLLGRLGVRERLGPLTALYLIGQFFSLFLPTSAGGDAVRIYQVARRSGRPGAALLATVQERLLGLGVTLLIGLAATLYWWPSLPLMLRVWGVPLQVAGMLAVGLLLYPAPLLAAVGWFWAGRPEWPTWLNKLRALAGTPGPRPLQLLHLLALAATAVLLGIGVCPALGRSLGIESGFAAFCLVIPLVWLVRMLPVSLNGLGVGEGAFVYLLGLFDVPSDKALALALALLGVQTAFGLTGGAILLLRLAGGTWRRAQPQPLAVPNEEGARHAA
jgi:uncharacterized membrane protein YbhN (UPF0104 family)